MDFRKTLSKPFKKLKVRLPGGRHKRDGRSGDGNDGKGGEADVEGSEASQRNSYLQSEVDVGGAVESGPSQEGNDADRKEVAPASDPPVSTPSISAQSGNPNGT